MWTTVLFPIAEVNNGRGWEGWADGWERGERGGGSSREEKT